MVLACLLVYITASIAALVIAAFVTKGEVTTAMFQDAEGLAELSQSGAAFPIIVMIPQFAMIVPVVIAASLSSVGFRKRLQLVRGHWPVRLWFTAAFATPIIGMISSSVVGAFLPDSESLVEMAKVFGDLADAGYMIPLAIMIGATPGICEELLFRGYVQTRLTQRLGGLIGIFITSIVFAAFHMDLVHSIAVFAIGVWLGWICHRSGSIFPAMLAHFVNNAVSVIAVSFALDSDVKAEEVPIVTVVVMLGMFVIGGACFTTTLAAAWKLGRPNLEVADDDGDEQTPEQPLVV